MKRFSFFAFITFLILLFAGCAILTPKNPVCNTDQPSVLCQASAKLGISLDNIGTTLKVGNIAALSKDAYTAQQALDFIDSCDLYLKNNQALTYSDFVRALTQKYLQLSPTVRACFILASADYNLNIAELSKSPLTAFDYQLLRKHLEQQRMLVAPFLMKG